MSTGTIARTDRDVPKMSDTLMAGVQCIHWSEWASSGDSIQTGCIHTFNIFLSALSL